MINSYKSLFILKIKSCYNIYVKIGGKMKNGIIENNQLKDYLEENELTNVENYWWFIATQNWVICGS